MSVLREIVAHKRAEVAERRKRSPRAHERAVVPSDRSFVAALEAPGLSLVAEVKRTSPSLARTSEILPSRFDPIALARAYDPSARAISVLTEARYFGGSLEDLARVRETTRRPVLCKDFVVDPEHQIPEARAHGADAILLMAQILAPSAIERALGLCRALGMEALVEVHDEDELARVLGETSARIVGINARDLDTLAIDLDRPRRLAARAREAGRIVVAESGLRSRGDVAALEGEVDAILVGSVLSRAADPGAALVALGFGPRPRRPAVKICGVRTAVQARAAHDAGADALGLNFVLGARRAVQASELDAIAVSTRGALRVGVFASPSIAEVEAAIARAELGAIQLHDAPDAPALDLAPFAALAARRGVALWRAIPVPSPDLRARLADAQRYGARVVLDAARAGSGRRFDPAALRGLVLPSDLVLAGGLDAEHVASCIARFEPAMVDVASGIEEDGAPSASRIASFVAAVRRSSPEETFHAAVHQARPHAPR
ncbi:MAG: bifunctional indole-3-glycerol-phosphate synthase TrpC/phosphoribosylanthranilate isomerase TrpF [Sandaracinaceae bacterium]